MDKLIEVKQRTGDDARTRLGGPLRWRSCETRCLVQRPIGKRSARHSLTLDERTNRRTFQAAAHASVGLFGKDWDES